VGGLVYVHRADGTVIVRRAPRSHAPFTAAQKASQSRFAKAVRWLREIKTVPELYAPYRVAARISRKRACDIAMADFMHPPEVRDVDVSEFTGNAGQIIRVCALDDVAVGSVTVVLKDLNDSAIESGAAIPDPNGTLWTYVTQTRCAGIDAVAVEVTAVDRPGNSVAKVMQVVVGNR
jgi:hypothetical protein